MSYQEYPRHLHKADGVYLVVHNDTEKADALEAGWSLVPVLQAPAAIPAPAAVETPVAVPDASADPIASEPVAPAATPKSPKTPKKPKAGG